MSSRKEGKGSVSTEDYTVHNLPRESSEEYIGDDMDESDANQKSVPSELTSANKFGLQQPLLEGTRSVVASGPVLDSSRPSKPRHSTKNGFLAKRIASTQLQSRKWSAEEKQALVVLKEEGPGSASGTDWNHISQVLWERYSFARDPTSCKNQWGALSRYYEAIQEHQYSTGATGWRSYWDTDADAKYKKKNKLPPSFPAELYAFMGSIIGSKSQREVDASLYHPAHPNAGCGSALHIGVGSGMLDMQDKPSIPDDRERSSSGLEKEPPLDANEKYVPSESTAAGQWNLTEAYWDDTLYDCNAPFDALYTAFGHTFNPTFGHTFNPTFASIWSPWRSIRGPIRSDSKARRFRSRNWSMKEKQAFLELREEELGSAWGTDWAHIAKELSNRYSIERNSKCCADLWGTMLKSFNPIRQHQSSQGATGWVSYWDMDADAKDKNKLPQSFPEESYTAMERIIANKCQLKGERQRKWRLIPPDNMRSKPSMEREVNASHYHQADPIAGCGFDQHIGEGSGMRDTPGTPDGLDQFAGCGFGQHNGEGSGMQDTPWIPDDGEDQTTTHGLAPFVTHQVEDAVQSALDDHIRPSYEESIPGAIYENDVLVASLSSHLTQLVQDPVNNAIEDYVSDKVPIDKHALFLLMKPLIAEEVRSAIEPISSSLLAQMRAERMFEQDLRALGKNKRALAREEEVLLKRQRVANRRPPGVARKRRGSAILPTLQGLNITSAEDLSRV